MNISEIAKELTAIEKNIVLIYAFNAMGKTRLSVAFKDETKKPDGKHKGVYYNAFSEDLFVWDNNTENHETNIRLSVLPSSLSKFHSSLTEGAIHEKLAPYNPKFGFIFNFHENSAKVIDTISFFIKASETEEERPNIKISRGEERIFIWCFFLALFEVADWTGNQPNHFFIDDPVSSLDDHNIFITASTLLDLINGNFKDRKIIITTHHIGLFSILNDWLTKGGEKDRFESETTRFILNKDDAGDLKLKESDKNEVFLYHLHLLQILNKAHQDDNLYNFHFVLLRQVLENIASFLGSDRFGHVLEQIEVENSNQAAKNINSLSHKKIYYHEPTIMNPDNKQFFEDIFSKLKEKYNFKL